MVLLPVAANIDVISIKLLNYYNNYKIELLATIKYYVQCYTYFTLVRSLQPECSFGGFDQMLL